MEKQEYALLFNTLTEQQAFKVSAFPVVLLFVDLLIWCIFRACKCYFWDNKNTF